MWSFTYTLSSAYRTLQDLAYGFCGPIESHYTEFRNCYLELRDLELESQPPTVIEYSEPDLDPLDKYHCFDYADAIHFYVQQKMKNDSVVILHNINLGAKPKAFWAKIPADVCQQFVNSDVVILKCKSVNQAMQIAESVEVGFATAMVMYGGSCLFDNEYQDEVVRED